MIDSVSFLGVALRSRSVLASGILGVTLSSLRRVCREGAGLVTTKSIGPEKRKGHHAPVLFDWGHGLINAVGLSNPGIDDFLAEWENAQVDFPFVLSIFGRTEEDFPVLAERAGGVDYTFLELNISCPNVHDEFGTPFSFSPELTFRITRSVKERAKKPVIVKLSPNTPLIKKVARSAEEGGADALCIMNTLGPGMVIDTHTATPVLGNKTGGISGEAALPITVRHVYELYKEVSIPIIGVGGISGTDGALQVMMAGAQLFGVGSALHGQGFAVFSEIDNGIGEFLAQNGFSSSSEIIGLAHREKRRAFFHVREGLKKRKREEEGKGPWFIVLPARETLCGEGGSVRTLFFHMNGPVNGLERPKPGQFYMLWLPGIDQKPYSVSFFRDGIIGFSIQERGSFSGALMSVEPLDPVGLLGPLGSSFDLSRDGPYLLAGGGCGFAPLIFAASALVERGKQVTVVAGAKNAPSLDWIHGLLERSGIASRVSIHCYTEDGSFGTRGMITDYLQGLIEALRPGWTLICGPEMFMQRAIEIFQKNGVAGQASIERMMKCGVGICGSCSLDDTGDRVCVEGPVFSFDYLSRLREFGKYHRDESGTMQRLT